MEARSIYEGLAFQPAQATMLLHLGALEPSVIEIPCVAWQGCGGTFSAPCPLKVHPHKDGVYAVTVLGYEFLVGLSLLPGGYVGYNNRVVQVLDEPGWLVHISDPVLGRGRRGAAT